MKKILLLFTILFTLVFSGSCLGSNKIIDLRLSGDLLDSKGVLAAGEIKRSSAATYINEGVLYTADGDDTPFSNASIEDETGATEMRGSFVDSQAWFHDAGGLIAVYADTGNLLILADPTLKAYGFIGEVGTGEVATPLANNVTAISKADPGVVSSVAHGLVVGDLVYFDSLTEMTELNTKYKVVTAVGSVDLFSINDTSGYTNAEVTGGACAHEVTEPNANAVHIYKEHGLLNEGWNAIDTGINYNADTAWDFDIYVNLLSSAGGTAQPRFEDGWLLVEPEATNLLLDSNTFNSWSENGACALSQNVTGPDGVANSAWTFTNGTGHGSNNRRTNETTVSPVNGTLTCSIFTKEGTSPHFSLRSYDITGSAQRGRVDFAWTNGVLSVSNEATGTGKVEQLGTTDWWRVMVFAPNCVYGNTHRIYIYPVDFDEDLGASATTIFYGAQVEGTPFVTSYIPTISIPVTRTTEAGSAADNGYSWTITQPLKNILDDAEPVGGATDSQGTLLFDIKWGCDESDIAAADNGLVAVNDAAQGLAYFDADSFDTHDDTLDSTYDHPAFSSGDEIYYAARWGDFDSGTNDISAGLSDGTWVFDATPANYDGEYGLGTDLRLSFSSLYPLHIRNIQFHDTPYSQAEIDAGIYRRVLKWMMHFELP